MKKYEVFLDYHADCDIASKKESFAILTELHFVLHYVFSFKFIFYKVLNMIHKYYIDLCSLNKCIVIYEA